MPASLFASVELAARIEAAETDLLRAAAEAAAPALGRPPMLRSLSGGLAVHTVNGSPLNKLAGLGFGGPLEEPQLTAVEAGYAARGAPFLLIELSTLAEPSIGELLTARGYRLVGFENVLGRALPGELSAAPEIRIETSPDLDVWIDVVVTGFSTPDTQGVASHEDFPRDVLERVMRGMAAARGLVHYLAHRAGQPAGGASMRVHGGVAQLTGAATLPAQRRRGVQTALLSRRLVDAARQGCDVAVATTQPGSRSQENMHKLGFQLLYSRAVLVRAL